MLISIKQLFYKFTLYQKKTGLRKVNLISFESRLRRGRSTKSAY